MCIRCTSMCVHNCTIHLCILTLAQYTVCEAGAMRIAASLGPTHWSLCTCARCERRPLRPPLSCLRRSAERARKRVGWLTQRADRATNTQRSTRFTQTLQQSSGKESSRLCSALHCAPPLHSAARLVSSPPIAPSAPHSCQPRVRWGDLSCRYAIFIFGIRDSPRAQPGFPLCAACYRLSICYIHYCAACHYLVHYLHISLCNSTELKYADLIWRWV